MNLHRTTILAQKAFAGYTRDNCSQMAAAIAYHILFAIVPLVMFVVSVLGLLLGTQNVQQRITDYMSESFDMTTSNVTLELSSEGMTRVADTYGEAAVTEVETELDSLNKAEREDERGIMANSLIDGETINVAGYELSNEDVDVHFDNVVLDAVRSVVNASGALGVVSFLVLGFAASGLFGQLRRSLDFVWYQRHHRAMVQGKLVDVALLFVLLALVVLMLVLLFALSIAASILFGIIGELRSGDAIWLESLFWTATSFLVPLGFSFSLFTLLYRYGPRPQNGLRDVWLGALLAAIGFEILKFGYKIYITQFAGFDVVYGALGGVLLFLVFVFFSAQVFLFGAEVAREYPRVRRGDYDDTESVGPANIREMIESGIRGLFVGRREP